MSNTIRIEVVLPEGFDKESVSVSVPAILPEKTLIKVDRLDFLREAHRLLIAAQDALDEAWLAGGGVDNGDMTQDRISRLWHSIGRDCNTMRETIEKEQVAFNARMISMGEAYKESNPPVADMCGKEPA